MMIHGRLVGSIDRAPNDTIFQKKSLFSQYLSFLCEFKCFFTEPIERFSVHTVTIDNLFSNMKSIPSTFTSAKCLS